MAKKELRTVKQVDGKGCGIACVAMITGKTYNEVKKDLIKRGFLTERNLRLHFKAMKNVLEHYRVKFSRLYQLDDYPIKSMRKNALIAVNYDASLDTWHWIIYDHKEVAVRDPNSLKKLRTDFGRIRIHAFMYLE